MKRVLCVTALATLIAAASFAGGANGARDGANGNEPAQIGVRPLYLVEDMDEGPLKEMLRASMAGPFYRSDFVIGHRGAPLQFPEHTRESYIAAVQQGAGICECDVTFTADRELVCRHAQCDLHTTTNILAIPELAAKCSEGFTPAEFDPVTGELITPASARCCTSDITLQEFRMLTAKMDDFNPQARTPEEYLQSTNTWRTDLYSGTGTLMTHAESIALFQELGVKMTPELKSPSVEMPFRGTYSQEDYAQQLIDEYRAAGVDPSDVFAQSFNLDDVLYWIEAEPEFGQQAVYLDGRYSDPTFDHSDPSTWSPNMEELVERNVRIIAPPMWMLLDVADDRMVASTYADRAKAAGLDIITWTLERSGLLQTGGGWYYQTVTDVTNNDGDTYEALHVLAQEVGILGIFTDWPATVTLYANCDACWES